MSSRIQKIYQNIQNKSGFSDFEIRKSQIEISEIIENSFENLQDCVIEAGTGIGKSIAYLIPSILFALENEQKVVISTETKSLQEQVKNKDIPLAMEILERDNLISEIAMGSSNYVCKRKYQNFLEQNPKKNKKMLQFDNWVEQTKTGFIQEYAGNFDKTSEIVRDANDCFAKKCPNFSSSYYFLQKKKWEEANILIVNHSLLASHIAADFSVLPKFSHLIIDEAHSFPNILCNAFRREIEFSKIKKFLDSLYDKKRGLVTKLQNETLYELIEQSKENLDLFFQKLKLNFGFMKISTERIKESLDIDGGNLESNFIQIHKTLSREVEKLTDNELLLIETQKKLKVLQGFVESLVLLRDVHDENTVFWIENGENFPKILIQRTDSDYLIAETLKEKIESVVFVSATLSIGDKNFSYFNQQIGMDKVKNHSFESPFNYRKNSILYLVDDLPSPMEKNQKLYKEQILKRITELLFLTEGNAFVLFTSKQMLQSIHIFLQDILPYPLFSQAEMGPIRAKEEFLQNENSVLMGLASFWQGVDIKGDKLKLVILVKLPFQTPDDPIFQHKAELLDKKKQNSFVNLQLPNACIHLKQGFGRLIRSSDDKGVVAILDSRIYQKSYGRYLLESLPNSKKVMSLESLKEKYQEL